MQHAVQRSGFRRLSSVLAIAVAVAFATPVSAQKSKDTLRMAFLEATQSVDNYTDPKPEAKFVSFGIFDNLVAYDEDKHQYGPLLAKTFKRIDDKTFEFELRDDIKWHDGESFDADDVVYTIGWLIDPKTKLRFKSNWDLIGGVEKLGERKVRVTTKEPAPNAFLRDQHLSRAPPQAAGRQGGVRGQAGGHRDVQREAG